MTDAVDSSPKYVAMWRRICGLATDQPHVHPDMDCERFARILSAEKRPSTLDLALICEAFGVTDEWLLTGNDCDLDAGAPANPATGKDDKRTGMSEPTIPDPKTVREIAREYVLNDRHRAHDIGPAVLERFGPDGLTKPEYHAYCDAVRKAIASAAVAVSWPDEQQPAKATGGKQVQDGADEAPCVCGDPNCMPYWRPVHQQINEMRLRSDRVAANFTKAMLEEICEERTRAEQAEAERDALAARVAELEAEREADARAVNRLLRLVEADPAFSYGPAAMALRHCFANRIAELGAAETEEP